MALPAAAIAFPLFCFYTRFLRGDLVDQLQGEDYVTTARAKGIGPWQVLLRHAFRNSSFGLITVVGLNLGTLIGGTVIVEQIFALPGIGQLMLQAINTRDFDRRAGAASWCSPSSPCWPTWSPTCSTPFSTRGSAMAVVDAVPLGQRPSRTSRPRGRPRRGVAAATWRSRSRPRRSRSSVLACFLGPLVLPVPPPIGGSVLESYLPALARPGTCWAPTPTATTSSPAILHGGRSSLVVAVAVNLLGLVVGGTLGRPVRLPRRRRRHGDHAAAGRAHRVPVAGAHPGGGAEPRREPDQHHPRAGVLLASRRSPGSPGPPRCGCASCRSWRPRSCAARRGGGCWLRHVAPEHRPAADHLRDARHGHRDRHRGRAELPRAGHPATRARAGAT